MIKIPPFESRGLGTGLAISLSAPSNPSGVCAWLSLIICLYILLSPFIELFVHHF